jgi:hypothetical protein
MHSGGATMRDLRRRLEQLEDVRLRRLAGELGKPYGLSADRILDEERRVLALSEAEQRQYLKHLYEELSQAQVAELDVIKRRHAAILRRAR